jgi:hypothetical protein
MRARGGGAVGVGLGLDPEPETGGGGGWAAGPLGEWVGLRRFVFFFFFLFLLHFQILSPNQFKQQTNFEFKPRFESNNQKQCTSMHATVNSYISLIN